MALRWLTPRMVLAIHAQAIAMVGGSSGVRDQGLLESALDRARNLAAYGDSPDIFDPAAHTILELNGYEVAPTEADIVTVIMGVADGTYNESVVAGWLRDCSRPKAR